MREGPNLYKSAFDGQFGRIHQSGRRYEVELVGIAQSDSALQRLLYFAEKIGSRGFNFVTNPSHRGMRQTIEGIRIKPLGSIAVEPCSDTQFAQKDPRGCAPVKTRLVDPSATRDATHLHVFSCYEPL